MTVRVWARALSVAVAVAAVTVGLAPQVGAATTSASSLPHTRKIVVRPVHSDGRPVRGYTVVGEHHDSGFTCDFHSPVAVSRGVAWCGASADATIACWKSRNHTVLCLRDPRVRTLVRIRYSGAFRAGEAVKHPEPQALQLHKHGYCGVRIGGAWGSVATHPGWVGYYACDSGAAVYGPLTLSGGIDRSVNPWRVHLVSGDGGGAGQAGPVIHTGRVAVAYFVGTAR